MDNSTEELFNQQTNHFKIRLNELKLFLISIYNPVKAERLSIEEFDLEHRQWIPSILSIWKFKMIVITFNIFTCLVFTINFSKLSFFLTSLLSISIPFADKYTWLRFIINGFLTNESKYYNLFLITFALHVILFFVWSVGLLWNSIGWYLLLIDPKNYGLLISFLIVVNSMLLTVYLILIFTLYFKLFKHIKSINNPFPQNINNNNEFQRLINNDYNDIVNEV